MTVEKIAYGGWPNCHRLANSKVDLIVTADVGPRVMRFGFLNQENQFKEFAHDLGKTGGEQWRLYGGHRLWHAPEARPRTYATDNEPIAVEHGNYWIRLTQPVEPTTGIIKEMELVLAPDAAHVTVTHRLRNANLWSIQTAPWALTLVALDGTAIIPVPPRGTHEEDLLPSHTVTLWAYTDMADPRWTWGSRYVLLRHNERLSPQKAGMLSSDGWVGHARAGCFFLKTFNYESDGAYPDLGCSVEVFTRWDATEVETLGPLRTLQPDAVAEHVEEWHLFDRVSRPATEAEVDRDILPLVQKARQSGPSSNPNRMS